MKFFEWVKKALFTKHRKTVVAIELAGGEEFKQKVGELTERMEKLADVCVLVREEAERAVTAINALAQAANEDGSQTVLTTEDFIEGILRNTPAADEMELNETEEA